MVVLLLLLIYLVFISLGLPDSIIGSCWPSICESLQISEDLQGFLTATVAICTVISSFSTVYLVRWLKERGVVILSIILTVVGLISMSYSSNFILFILSAIPLGLGAGAIDTVLNNYVAIHYKALHLNWLHAFWGVGAMVSPFIISAFLTDINGWRNGALVIACIQATIGLISLIGFPLWKKVEFDHLEERSEEQNEEIKEEKIGIIKTFRLKGVIFAVTAFFSYIAIESLMFSWFSSMCVFGLNVSNQDAAMWAGLYFIGMTVGRFISGIVSLKIKDKYMIRIGEVILLVGVILLMMTFNPYIMPFGVFLVGLGCAPIYPAIIHSTPDRFTEKYSGNVISVQVGCAYIANVTIGPLFGVLAKATTFLLLPYAVLLFLIICLLCNEITLYKTKNKDVFLNK